MCLRLRPLAWVAQAPDLGYGWACGGTGLTASDSRRYVLCYTPVTYNQSSSVSKTPHNIARH